MSTGLIPDMAAIEAELQALRHRTLADALGHLSGNAIFIGDAWRNGALIVRVQVKMRNVKGHIVPSAKWVLNGRHLGYNALLGELRKYLLPVQKNLPL